MNTNERIRALAREAREIMDKADAEGRELSADEEHEVERRLKTIRTIETGHAINKAFDMGGDVDVRHTDGSSRSAGDPGAAFVQSEGFKRIQDPATRGQRWSTGAIPVGSFQTKAGTVFESAQGAGLVPVPQVLPGVTEKLFQPIQVTDLFATIQATSSAVRYAVEGTATSGAAGVAEGGAKPASDIALSTVDEPVKKIATSITVSDELIDDASSAQGFVNGRLSLFVQLEEERQLLRGGGTNELVGIVGRTGVNVYTKAAGDDNVTAIAKVIGNTAGSSFVQPTGIVMHPQNWLASRLLRDGAGGTIGAYFGAGPFGVAAQNAGAAGLFGQSLWDVPIASSTTVGLGTAVVGGFANAAAIARRSGVTVEASNSHSDYFLKDLVAIRAEQREALLCYRPNAFTVVSGLTS